MVSSLQSIVLFSVPIAILIDMLKILHHLPMGHELFRTLFRRCTHEELRAWAKTFPWDHPVARKLDHEVHRRRMADSWEYVENQPVCHIYQWVAHPTHGGVCNHCERMMDGFRLDDMIAGLRVGTLTEDEIVEYVQSGDPNHRDWDEWPLRMTFRINSFLREHGPVGDADLEALGFLED
ncbi:unnamed protein product [Porites lobata]|uniref:Uncharacterized protein n=1 Tax=Porites lobata TaxID=104759 RepID=A0ABN8N699_9CNID|nr:unnamed protein product [Porites lobata]